jgi:hypothetical protein
MSALGGTLLGRARAVAPSGRRTPGATGRSRANVASWRASTRLPSKAAPAHPASRRIESPSPCRHCSPPPSPPWPRSSSPPLFPRTRRTSPPSRRAAWSSATSPSASTVKDLKVSQAFYEKLDFKQVGGKPAQNWVVLQNGPTTIGLFQGMFERNMLTFNPGWNVEQGDAQGVPGRARAPEPSSRNAASRCKPEADPEHRRPGELHPHRPRRQPDPRRPARAQAEALGTRHAARGVRQAGGAPARGPAPPRLRAFDTLSPCSSPTRPWPPR